MVKYNKNKQKKLMKNFPEYPKVTYLNSEFSGMYFSLFFMLFDLINMYNTVYVGKCK